MLFSKLGEQLRQAREARGLSLRDLEQITRIRVKYLHALEQGNFDTLPTGVQLRGFIRNYAQEVGIDPEGAVLDLQQAIQSRKQHGWHKLFRRRTTDDLRILDPDSRPAAMTAESAMVRPVESGKRGRMRRIISPDTFVSVALFCGLIVFFFWGGARLAASVRSPSPVLATPVVLGPTITPTFLLHIPATLTSPPPLVHFSDVQLTLLAVQRSFVRVNVDGVMEFQGMLHQGERRDYIAKEHIELITGNGAGVHVLFNQQDKGLMGEFGEVVTWTFSPSSMSTASPEYPTPLPSMTVAATIVP